MNVTQKSASIRIATFFFSLLLLSGCADTKWPGWMTGEPGDRVLNAPRPINSLKEKEKTTAWPALGDAPSRPEETWTEEERRDIIKGMTADQKAAVAIGQRLDQESADMLGVVP